MRLVVVGTSHIAKQSIEEIKTIIEEEKPEIVALELDFNRLQALLSKRRAHLRLGDIKRVGLKGYLFALFGGFVQKKLGKSVGVMPGSEMVQAITLAKHYNLHIALIDQNIETTLRRFSAAFGWKERFRFLADVFKGIFFKGKMMEQFRGFDLRTVPKDELIEKMVEQVKERYPSIYRVLIEERNKVMIKNLKQLLENNPDKKVLAVIGAGHKKAIEAALNGFMRTSERKSI